MTHRFLQPATWPRPKGYANGMVASGRLVFTAGIVGWNEHEVFEHSDLVGQFRQALANTLTVLAEADAGPPDVVRMTCYITDRRMYLAHTREIGAVWREVMGRHYPCMAVVEVTALLHEKARIEIETTAVVDEARSATRR